MNVKYFIYMGMKSTVWLFDSSCIWEYTASAVEAVAECWGAGGHGNISGTGGSGGAYAARKFMLVPGKYEVFVGTCKIGDGEHSYIESIQGVIAKAAGGQVDGGTGRQKVGSVGDVVAVGGVGGKGSHHAGGGGGGCAGAGGDGLPGQVGDESGPTTPAVGGIYNNKGKDARGGDGAYYNAGAGINRVVVATPGDAPGCGGGGAMEGFERSAAPGGQGYVMVWTRD